MGLRVGHRLVGVEAGHDVGVLARLLVGQTGLGLGLRIGCGSGGHPTTVSLTWAPISTRGGGRAGGRRYGRGVDADAVLTLLQDVAAEVVTPRFRALDPSEVASKRRPGDLVTVADREAEVLLTRALRAAHPGAVVVGEEAVSADPSLLRGWADAPLAFTVDPVDGTRHFVKGSPDHAVMVAEVRRGEVVRSWIWQPQHRTAYVAERGAGAWRDGVRLGRPTATPSRTWTGTCCGIDYPRLATGEARRAAWFKTKPWDHAPGSLLLTEAGGSVGSLVGPRRTPYRPGRPPRVLLAHSA